jgi:hypothetical protein
MKKETIEKIKGYIIKERWCTIFIMVLLTIFSLIFWIINFIASLFIQEPVKEIPTLYPNLCNNYWKNWLKRSDCKEISSWTFKIYLPKKLDKYLISNAYIEEICDDLISDRKTWLRRLFSKDNEVLEQKININNWEIVYLEWSYWDIHEWYSSFKKKIISYWVYSNWRHSVFCANRNIDVYDQYCLYLCDLGFEDCSRCLSIARKCDSYIDTLICKIDYK